jgi:hypothetical protein
VVRAPPGAAACCRGQVTEDGFHLIQLLGRESAGVAPFDEVKDQIAAAASTRARGRCMIYNHIKR